MLTNRQKLDIESESALAVGVADFYVAVWTRKSIQPSNNATFHNPIVCQCLGILGTIYRPHAPWRISISPTDEGCTGAPRCKFFLWVDDAKSRENVLSSTRSDLNKTPSKLSTASLRYGCLHRKPHGRVASCTYRSIWKRVSFLWILDCLSLPTTRTSFQLCVCLGFAFIRRSS